jgi:hypothetical protein
MFVLLDGTQRLQGATEVGLTEIPALIRYDITAASDVWRYQIQSNAHSIRTKPTQYAEQIGRFLALNPSSTQEDVGRWLNKTGAWVSQMLSLRTLIDEAKELVESGAINATNAIKLARLPKTEQEHYVDDAQNMGTTAFAETVNDALAELRKLNRGQQAGFEAKAKTRSKDTIGLEYQTYIEMGGYNEMCPDDLNNLRTRDQEAYNIGYADALAWAISLDATTVQAAKAEHEAKVAEKERKKAEKARLKEQEKASKEGKIVNAPVLPLGFG